MVTLMIGGSIKEDHGNRSNGIDSRGNRSDLCDLSSLQPLSSHQPLHSHHISSG